MKTPPEPVSCASCRFFKHNASTLSECRRHAPAPIAVSPSSWTHLMTMFPAMSPDGWCGEYEARD